MEENVVWGTAPRKILGASYIKSREMARANHVFISFYKQHDLDGQNSFKRYESIAETTRGPGGLLQKNVFGSILSKTLENGPLQNRTKIVFQWGRLLSY